MAKPFRFPGIVAFRSDETIGRDFTSQVQKTNTSQESSKKRPGFSYCRRFAIPAPTSSPLNTNPAHEYRTETADQPFSRCHFSHRLPPSASPETDARKAGDRWFP
jgi:hypothetical protein